MNSLPRNKKFMGAARRHSWSHIIQVPFYLSEDDEQDIENEKGTPHRINLTVRQPSFSFLSSDPSFDRKLVTKDGRTLDNHNTIVFEPNFDRKISQYPYVDVMKSLCNKSIYSDLSAATSNEENSKNNKNIKLSLSLTLPSFSSEEPVTDLFTDPDDDIDQFTNDFQFNSTFTNDQNFGLIMDLKRINAEKWNNIGYIPPNIL